MNREFRITKVTARNFRSIVHARMDLDRLTVLVGPNASGKSNTMDIPRFIRDALRFDVEAALSNRDGFAAIRYKTNRGRPRDMDLGVEGEFGSFAFGYDFTIAADSQRGFRVKREFIQIHYKEENLFSILIEEGKTNNVIERGESSFKPPSRGSDIRFGTDVLSLGALSTSFHPAIPDESNKLIYTGLSRLRRHLRDMQFYHIFPKDIREPQKLRSYTPLEEHGENLSSVLKDMNKRHPQAKERLRDALGHLVPYCSSVKVTSTGGYLVTRLKHVDSSDSGKWFDLSQESDGTLRLLGLLTALYQQPTPTFIGIEEPEFAIHPGALTALAELLDEASLVSQVMITTHSPELMDYLPVDSLRIVVMVDGETRIGKVSKRQRQVVREKLFLPGELHQIEGLRQAAQPGG